MRPRWNAPGRTLAAIQADGLTTAAGIGALLKAGTNCGSCIPELKKLLQSVPALNAAE
ncbi:MAG TPA: (2Fe-2S)-binding protein [Rhizomicrobium sp.]|nr:(2Fe-2S)-binding protein [Rhizomicrobium sp.]